jgi:hypothetical protein
VTSGVIHDGAPYAFHDLIDDSIADARIDKQENLLSELLLFFPR